MSNEQKNADNKPIRVGSVRLTHLQFRVLTAMGVVSASLGHLLPDGRVACGWLDTMISRQVVTVVTIAALLGFIVQGLRSYKQAAEMVWVERFALLFWAAYAGSSLGDLFGG